MSARMIISGVEYVEAKPKPMMDRFSGVCEQCAFGVGVGNCAKAIESSPGIFGGDCQQRDVIYVPAAKEGE
jgi:hypothetical protein